MLITRIAAAAVFAPALFWLVYRGGVPLKLACVVLSIAMLWEYLRMVLGSGALLEKSVAYAVGACLFLKIFAIGPDFVTKAFLPLLPAVLLSVALLSSGTFDKALSRAAAVALGVLYTCGMLPYLAVLRDAPVGITLSLMALFCTWGADTGGYFAGRFLGRTKLAPKISPKKTVEGAVGGILAAVGVAFIVRAVFAAPLHPFHTMALGVLAAVCGTIGDLCESLIKRAMGVKDSSALIPGHGGVLDRFDAVMFVCPVFWAFSAFALS